jgi:hypothetical protein
LGAVADDQNPVLCALEFAGATATCCHGVDFMGPDPSAPLLLLALLVFLATAAFLRFGKPAPPGSGPADQSGEIRLGPVPISLAGTDAHVLLLCWLGAPLAVAFLFSHLVTPVFVTRTLIAAALPLLLLAAGGWATLPGERRSRSFVLALLIVFNWGCYDLYASTISRCQWREAWQFLEREATPADLLLFDTPDWSDFYQRREDLKTMRVPFANGELTVEGALPMAERISQVERVWLVRSHSLDFDDIVPQLLGRLLPFRGQTSFAGINILRFDRTGRSADF